MKSRYSWTACAAGLAAVLLLASAALAQPVTLPPSGENQKASVSQWIGPVEVNITYSSPDVTAPDGTDRTGKIWGELVPYGMANLGFGSCGENCPWRAGANENTVFRTSHDVKIQGKRLAAGSYGVHMIPGAEEWTIVFSSNSTSWGSFFYDAAEDALRVTVKPEESEYTHWLTYEFTDRQPTQATVALKWENLAVPWTVTVDTVADLYVENLRRELRSAPGFNWQGWRAAAQYCLRNDTNLTEALTWAQNAVSLPFVGQENFQTLQMLAQLQEANDLAEEANATFDKALQHPTASSLNIHQAGRQLIGRGEKERALEVFQLNAERNGDTWPVNVGLARGYSAVGRYAEALKYAKLALAQAPDEGNRTNLERMIGLLEEGKDIN